MLFLILRLLALALWLAVCWFAAGEFYKIAEDKGYHGKKYFWWCFLARLLPSVRSLLIRMRFLA